MFSKRNEKKSEILLEQMEVKRFLENSYEFNKMKIIASKPNMNDFSDFHSRLENCESFSELVYHCSAKYDIETSDNFIIYKLGRNNVNAMLFMSGFFSDKPNYHYFALHFYESIFTYLDAKRENKLIK